MPPRLLPSASDGEAFILSNACDDSKGYFRISPHEGDGLVIIINFILNFPFYSIIQLSEVKSEVK